MSLTDWGLGRFEGAFKGCARQLKMQRSAPALGAVKALQALEAAWGEYCQFCQPFEALHVDVALAPVSCAAEGRKWQRPAFPPLLRPLLTAPRLATFRTRTGPG